MISLMHCLPNIVGRAVASLGPDDLLVVSGFTEPRPIRFIPPYDR
jgi:hypothetical protein